MKFWLHPALQSRQTLTRIIEVFAFLSRHDVGSLDWSALLA